MTNSEAAAHFASLPPDSPAMVLLVDGDTGMIESLDINTPGTNLENVEKGVIDEDQLLLATTYRKW